MALATHLQQIHWVNPENQIKEDEELVTIISTWVRRPNLYAVSLEFLILDSGACNFIFMVSTNDFKVKLCNPYIVKPKIKVKPYMVVI